MLFSYYICLWISCRVPNPCEMFYLSIYLSNETNFGFFDRSKNVKTKYPKSTWDGKWYAWFEFYHCRVKMTSNYTQFIWVKNKIK